MLRTEGHVTLSQPRYISMDCTLAFYWSGVQHIKDSVDTPF